MNIVGLVNVPVPNFGVTPQLFSFEWWIGRATVDLHFII